MARCTTSSISCSFASRTVPRRPISSTSLTSRLSCPKRQLQPRRRRNNQGLRSVASRPLILARARTEFLAEGHRKLLGRRKAGLPGDFVDLHPRVFLQHSLGKLQPTAADVLVG